MHWYFDVIKKYAVFEGRARRQEYWMFFLFNFLIAMALAIVEAITGIAPESEQSVLVVLYELAILVPAIAVGVRRMHDTDHSGWWLLFPLVNLVFALTDGQRGENRFGPDPKGQIATGVPIAAVGPVAFRTDGQIPVAFCIHCGSKFSEVAAYCSRCGASRAG